MVWRLPAAWWRRLAWVALALTLAPLPLDTRTAPPMGLLYVVGIGARPLGLLGLWLAHAMFAFGARASGRPAAAAAPRRA
jgi:hypothetical protein